MKRYFLFFLSYSFLFSMQAQLVLERDINLEAASSDPYAVAELNDVLYFSADDGIHGEELYQYDLATGLSQLVVNIRPYEVGSGIYQVLAFEDKIYFAGKDGIGSDDHLFVYDPADQSTQRLKDINYQDIREPVNVFEFDGQLFFGAEFSGFGVEIGRYDPIANEIHMIADINDGGNGFPNFFQEVDGELWFVANDGQSNSRLWRYDAMNDTVENILYISPDSVYPSMSSLHYLDGAFYFQGFISGMGSELWGYDIASNTLLDIPEVYPGAGSSSPSNLTSVDGKLYFAARTAADGRELRVYDPATNTTSLVADINPTGNGNPGVLLSMGDQLFFTASMDDIERSLFSYDPITQTLTEEAGLDNNATPNYLTSLIVVDSTVFLAGNKLDTGNELYQFSLGSGMISLAADINETTIGSDPFQFTPFNGKLYFGADEINSGQEIWVYDPSTGDVEILSDGPGSLKPYNFTALGDKLFFSGIDPIGGYGLLYYDETLDQILPTSYLTPSNTGHITDIIAYEDRIYFSADNDSVGQELFAYDPATSSHTLVADIHPTDDANPERFFVFEGDLFFQADDGVTGRELWRYNDSLGQLSLVADLNPGGDGSDPDWYAVFNGELYFSAFVDGSSTDIYSYDPATDMIQQRTDASNSLNPEYLTVYHDKLFFKGRYSSSVNVELLYFDPVLDSIILTEDLNPSASNPRDLIVFNDKLYFSTFTDDFGRELWQYNDTALSIVTDIWPGVPDADPEHLTLFNGKLYFAANDGLRGSEIWSMAECLNLFVDAEPQIGPSGSGTIDLTIVGGQPPYTIVWSNGDSTEDLSELEPGLYTATVSDASGCLSTISAEVLLLSSQERLLDQAALSLYPNPSSGSFVVELKQGGIEAVKIYSLQGKQEHQQSFSGNPAQVQIEMSNFVSGLYIIHIHTNKGLAIRKLLIE